MCSRTIKGLRRDQLAGEVTDRHRTKTSPLLAPNARYDTLRVIEVGHKLHVF